MADLAKTISNSIVCLGPYQTQKWGGAVTFPMVWGTSKWGERAMYTMLEMNVSVANTVTGGFSLSKHVNKLVSETVASAMETGSETLQTTNGYYYVFIRPSTDAENRSAVTYVASTGYSPTWTSLTVTTTTWS